MKISASVLNVLSTASAKALATTGASGLNVVPVSTVRIMDSEIYLVDYFFGKTRQNLQTDSAVALTFWSGLMGYQLKAETNYLTAGAAFEAITKWGQQNHPERTVYGVVKLTPTAVFDISVPKS